MPKSIISEGKTTNEAIENGLTELHVSRNEVEIKVLENEDKRSFFSILAPRVVKVELTLKEKNEKEEKEHEHHENTIKEPKKYSTEELDSAEKNIKIFLDEFLTKIDEKSSYEVIKTEAGLEIYLKGNGLGILIGYRGDTLYSLQNILISIASKGINTKIRVILDIEGYKEKREKTLRALAERMAKQVIKTGKSVTLEPMKAYERKIIHTELQDSSKVETYSIGEEPRRKVVVALKNN